MRYELDKSEAFQLSQLKLFKKSEAPVFQKCHDDTLDGAREKKP